MRRLTEPFKLGMHFFGVRVGIFVNTILLTAVYFTGIGITSLVARIMGKKMLDDQIGEKDTYWTPIAKADHGIARHKHQF